MNSLLDIQSIEAMEVDGNGDNPIKGNIVQQGVTIIQNQQITNWVGRVQELIMKKRIVCKWNDAYTCQNEKTNNIMHNCKLQFDILDSTANNLLKRLEADSQARNKKMAKQLAFCKIHELLIAEYGHFNQLNEREIKSKDNLIVIDEQISKEVLVVDDKEKKEISNNDTTTNTITTQISSLSTNKFSLTLSPNDLQELEHIERSQDWDETIDIRLLLSDLLNDRAVNTPRSERLLRCILKGKNPQVERVFYKPELNFIESFKSEDNDNFQIYLEIFVIHNNKKILLCTFGGEGKDKQGARDDASWQAMEYLYVYGGFAPRGKKEY
ncbi:hypothetical protein Mgra_00003577 [Meloidogyne graminicola]|uniref:DRBM domain-containing protein n=1 Tax=Meloidogyne graminicola TaxID=189291 RepID=A0A8S9ZUW8_9BILA|nr:hypothetical protein Mgra_00003577 [Meloidogyne graminicola]